MFHVSNWEASLSVFFLVFSLEDFSFLFLVLTLQLKAFLISTILHCFFKRVFSLPARPVSVLLRFLSHSVTAASHCGFPPSSLSRVLLCFHVVLQLVFLQIERKTCCWLTQHSLISAALDETQTLTMHLSGWRGFNILLKHKHENSLNSGDVDFWGSRTSGQLVEFSRSSTLLFPFLKHWSRRKRLSTRSWTHCLCYCQSAVYLHWPSLMFFSPFITVFTVY